MPRRASKKKYEDPEKRERGVGKAVKGDEEEKKVRGGERTAGRVCLSAGLIGIVNGDVGHVCQVQRGAAGIPG